MCANQRCFLLQICKVELPYQCLPSFHQCLQNAAFHSPAFLPCVALAFHLSCLNASGLETGTASTTANLSSNSTSPPVPHAMHKCFSVSCLAALFPSLPQWLLSSDTSNNVSTKRRGGYKPPVLHTKSMLVCVVSLGQECSLLLVGGTFLLHWPAAVHNWHSWPPLVQLTKRPVVQNVAVLNEGSDDLDWWCMYLVFKYLSWSGNQFKFSLLNSSDLSVDYFRQNIYLVSFKKRRSFGPRKNRQRVIALNWRGWV